VNVDDQNEGRFRATFVGNPFLECSMTPFCCDRWNPSNDFVASSPAGNQQPGSNQATGLLPTVERVVGVGGQQGELGVDPISQFLPFGAGKARGMRVFL
jgi:hypothetical protein